MRVVLDTNILLSALINRHGTPAQLIAGWRERRYDLITSTEQLTLPAAQCCAPASCPQRWVA